MLRLACSRGLAVRRLHVAARPAAAAKAGKEAAGGGGEYKWKTLQHHGPLFPPAYEPLPAKIAVLVRGKPQRLGVAAEECAVLYARVQHLDIAQHPTFRANFLRSWLALMSASERAMVTSLDHCDFSPIVAHLKAQADARKSSEHDRGAHKSDVR